MDALWISTGIVALAEIGDKTQLLAIVLAARFRKPWPIIGGIFVATLLNHAAAAGLGYIISQWLSGDIFRIAVGVSFIIMAAWALIPDKEDDRAESTNAGGVFLTTLVAFFLVEIGDKTQIATSLLAARYQEIALVTAGTTLGMMLANVPAVFVGDRLAQRLPTRLVHGVAAAIFAVIGVLTLLGAGAGLGF